MDMVSDFFRESLAGVGDIYGILRRHQDFLHFIIRDLGARYVGRVDDVQRRRDRRR